MAVEKIICGGQTGADRGGLDAAIDLGIEHGGWCPKGRRAEDGLVPKRYRLTETSSSGYRERRRRNVLSAEATVIFTRGTLSGGSRLNYHRSRIISGPYGIKLGILTVGRDSE